MKWHIAKLLVAAPLRVVLPLALPLGVSLLVALGFPEEDASLLVDVLLRRFGL